MTGPFGVHSEVGRLRQAFVHRPGLELSRLTPGNCDDLWFDDALWADVRGFGTSAAAVVRHLDTEQAAGLRLAAGSMGPKVEACRRFVTATGQVANIGALTEAHAVLEGTVGTTISMVASDPAPPTSLFGTPR